MRDPLHSCAAAFLLPMGRFRKMHLRDIFRNSLDFFHEKCYNSKLYITAGVSA